MRYAANHKQEARARILEAAERGFRRSGLAVGIDGLAQEAGVTSGAFYGHFRSKMEAFTAVVRACAEHLRLSIEAFQKEYGQDWLKSFAAEYLGPQHRQDMANSCILPSLSAEVHRAGTDARSAYQAELLEAAHTLAEGLKSGSPAERRADAWAILATLAGGVLLSRAVNDEAVAQEIAEAAKSWIERSGL